MARKRTIDPNIWASEDMARLDIFARYVFIGLFANADDEGKGKANSSYLKSLIFPFDEEITSKKISSSLKKIAENCSAIFYEVQGKSYYKLLNWKKWQKPEKPQPSLIPEPFGERSGNSRGIVGEQSGSVWETIGERSGKEEKEEKGKKEKEAKKEKTLKEEKEEYITHTQNARACAPVCEDNKTLSVFIERTGLSDTYWLDGFDYEAIANEISLSKKFLQTVTSFTFFVNNYDKVVSGSYRDFKEAPKRDKNSIHFANERSYTKEELAGMITDVDEIDI